MTACHSPKKSLSGTWSKLPIFLIFNHFIQNRQQVATGCLIIYITRRCQEFRLWWILTGSGHCQTDRGLMLEARGIPCAFNADMVFGMLSSFHCENRLIYTLSDPFSISWQYNWCNSFDIDSNEVVYSMLCCLYNACFVPFYCFVYNEDGQ